MIRNGLPCLATSGGQNLLKRTCQDECKDGSEEGRSMGTTIDTQLQDIMDASLRELELMHKRVSGG